MKKLLSFALLMTLLFSAPVDAQVHPKTSIKRFHLELSTGLVIPSGLKEAGLDMGAPFSIEPRYVLSSNLKIGLRMEAALMFKNIRPRGEGFESNYMEESGYLITIDHLCPHGKEEFFVGFGAGIMDIMSDDLDPLTLSVQSVQKTTYACMIRGGVEFCEKKFRTGIEYNLVGPASFSRTNHYLSLKIGAMLFTKKRSKV